MWYHLTLTLAHHGCHLVQLETFDATNELQVNEMHVQCMHGYFKERVCQHVERFVHQYIWRHVR